MIKLIQNTWHISNNFPERERERRARRKGEVFKQDILSRYILHYTTSTFESSFILTWIPFIQCCFVPIFYEIKFYREGINVFTLFEYPVSSPVGDGCRPPFEELFSFTQGCFVISLIRLVQGCFKDSPVSWPFLSNFISRQRRFSLPSNVTPM